MTIAIGIPVTKIAYLADALRSIADQSTPVAEVVVVDNGADGDVAGIIAAEYPRAILYRNDRQLPPVENWNLVVSYITADWLILLSDDDYMAPDHVSQITAVNLACPAARLIHTRVFIVDENGKKTGISPLAAATESCYDLLMHRQLGYRAQFLSDFVWQTDCLRMVGGFADLPSAWGTDDLTAFRMAKVAGVAYGSKPTFYYRMHANNITNAHSVYKKLLAICSFEDALRSELTSSNPSGHECDDYVRSRCMTLMDDYRGRMQLYVLNNVKGWNLIGVFIRAALSGNTFRISLRVACLAFVRKIVSGIRGSS